MHNYVSVDALQKLTLPIYVMSSSDTFICYESTRSHLTVIFQRRVMSSIPMNHESNRAPTIRIFLAELQDGFKSVWLGFNNANDESTFAK